VRNTTARRHAHLRRLADLELTRHYREPLTVADVARRLGISRRALQRAYAHSADTTFDEQLRATRLRAGAELLAGQSIAVADVARLVGFRSASAFAAAFARRYGRTPARYRAEARAARTTQVTREAYDARRAREQRARLISPTNRPRTAATGRGS